MTLIANNLSQNGTFAGLIKGGVLNYFRALLIALAIALLIALPASAEGLVEPPETVWWLWPDEYLYDYYDDIIWMDANDDGQLEWYPAEIFDTRYGEPFDWIGENPL